MAITLEIESVAVDSVSLRWLDDTDPTDTFEIRRSEDGVAFDLIDTTAASATTYFDSGLPAETRFWYKVTNQTPVESAVKSVVTQACWTPSAANELSMALPTSDHVGDVTSYEFNDAMRRLEAIIRNQSAGRDCVACSVNGALVLRCDEGCRDFVVDIQEDINSISIIGCENGGDGSLEFKVPAGECYAVCGFPNGFGFSGEECFDTEICGGDDGRGVKVYWSGGGQGAGTGAAGGSFGGEGVKAKTPSGTGGTGTGTGGGGSGGGGPLTLTCLTSTGAANDLCSIDCINTKELRLRASGGSPPYTFTTNSSGTYSTVNSTTKKIVPPANAGSGVAGAAYTIEAKLCDNNGGVTRKSCNGSNFTCNDVWNTVSGAIPTSCDGCGCTNGSNCANVPLVYTSGNPSGCSECVGGTNPLAYTSKGRTVDLRTAGMITDGCNPCGNSMANKTVTVTDSVGTSVTKTVRA